MRTRTRRPALVVLALAVLLGAGCGAASRPYVNPQADLTAYRKVAMLPFTNLSPDRFAGERVSRALMTELIASSPYRLIEPAEFWSMLVAIGGEPGVDGVIKPDKLKEAAAKLEVQGIIRGAVTDYQVLRIGNGDVPQVGFDVEMIDAPSGNVVWRSSIQAGGRGRIPVVGSGGGRSLGVVTRDACRKVVAELRGKAL
jgi:TolB-like protein